MLLTGHFDSSNMSKCVHYYQLLWWLSVEKSPGACYSVISTQNRLEQKSWGYISRDESPIMMEEVVLEGEVEGGGSLQEKEEEEDARLSGSILKDDSICVSFL